MKATEVTAGLAESNGGLLPGLWRDSLHVTCGLTACTLGSAPGPTLGNEYGKTLPLPSQYNCWSTGRFVVGDGGGRTGVPGRRRGDQLDGPVPLRRPVAVQGLRPEQRFVVVEQRRHTRLQ